MYKHQSKHFFHEGGRAHVQTHALAEILVWRDAHGPCLSQAPTVCMMSLPTVPFLLVTGRELCFKRTSSVMGY